MNNLGLHATPRKNTNSIQKKGLHTQPFWKNRNPLKRLLGGRATCPAWVIKLDKRLNTTLRSRVEEVLERANRHLGKKNTRIQLKKIQLFLVDLDASEILKDTQPRVSVKSPPQALKSIFISNKDIAILEKRTKDLSDQQANKIVVDFVTAKVREVL